MITKELSILFGTIKLTREKFTNIILIIFTVISIPTVIFAIPSIVSLIKYKKDKNLNQCFHKFTTVFMYIIMLLGVFFSTYYFTSLVFLIIDNYNSLNINWIVVSIYFILVIVIFWYATLVEILMRMTFEKEDGEKEVELDIAETQVTVQDIEAN